MVNQTSTFGTLQNIILSLWVILFFPFPVKFYYLEIYFISEPRNSTPKKKRKKVLFSRHKTI